MIAGLGKNENCLLRPLGIRVPSLKIIRYSMYVFECKVSTLDA